MTPAPGNPAANAPSPAWRRWWIAGATAFGFGVWWVGSILLHTLVFGLLYVASPKARQTQDAANDFHMTISPEHVQAVVADIRQEQKEEFTKKVAELASVKAQLDALDTQKVEQYNALMKEQAKQAPQLVQEAAAEAKAGQAAVLQAQAEAQAAIAKMDAAQAKAASAPNDDEKANAQQEFAAATQATEKTQADASQAQKSVAAAQTKLAQQINLFGDAAADARQTGQTAAAAQSEAEQQQDGAASARVEVPREQQQMAQLTAEAQRARATDDDAKQKVQDIEKRLADLRSPPATPTPSPVASPAGPATDPAARPPANVVAVAPPPLPASSVPVSPVTTPAPTPEPTPSKEVKQEIDQLTRTLPQAVGSEAKLATRLSDAERKLATQQAESARRLSQLQADQDQARQKQQFAAEAQAKAAQQAAETLAKSDLSPTTATPTFSPPPAVPSDANLAQLYSQAQQMETAVAKSYKNVRAAELATIRQIPMSQAMSLTEVAKPVRGQIDTSILTREISDVQGVREQEQTLQAASAQMNSMVALAQRMKELAQPAQQAVVSVDAMKATTAHSEHMEQLAAEDEGTKAKDLTAVMKGAESADVGGHGESGHDDANQAAAVVHALEAVADASAKMALNPLDPQTALEYHRALEDLNALGALAAKSGAGPTGSGDPRFANTAPEAPYLNAKNFKPVPGRTITNSMVAGTPGREQIWMFVDSWYIIGPWPNPRRKNLNTAFPPESVVDLDATYTGGRKDERPMPIRWRFHQDSAVRMDNWGNEMTGLVVPPGLDEFEIYYAYTELWLDEAADLWVAIGSDDQSKIWLNDQMIWKSADYYKSWAANEGLRKVHFNKGINRILYRLENGQNSGGYSLMVCLNPKVAPPPEAKH